MLAGAISDGRSIRAAEVLGADLAYLGTRFIATKESNASDAYKQMVANYKDGPAPTFLPTVYTDKISGVPANFLRESLVRSGLDPENPEGEGLGQEDFGGAASKGCACAQLAGAVTAAPDVAGSPRRCRACGRRRAQGVEGRLERRPGHHDHSRHPAGRGTHQAHARRVRLGSGDPAAVRSTEPPSTGALRVWIEPHFRPGHVRACVCVHLDVRVRRCL